MPTAIFLTHYVPTPIGHGGNHRAYQIWADLQAAFGPDNVVLACLPLWQADPPLPSQPVSRSLGIRIRQRLKRTLPVRGILKAMALARRGGRYARRQGSRSLLLFRRSQQAAVLDNQWRLGPGYSGDFVLAYGAMLARTSKPAICFVEHVGFTECLRLNQMHGIPTVCCSDNLESLDARLPDPNRLSHVFDTCIDFAHEFRLLANCQDRLFISRVETAIVSGLGLDSHYYPYLPVGAIRNRMREIAARRTAATVDPRLLLMVGTAWHSTTAESFGWFLSQVAEYGLPPGVRLLVAGGGTDKLVPAQRPIPGVDILGLIDQARLDDLMERAAAFVVPQRVGFGALTRLPELACGGIPTIVARHATYAIEPTPGMCIADGDWQHWRDLIERLTRSSPIVAETAYLEWEERQVRPIAQMAPIWNRPAITKGLPSA